jgi:hypothetical protein
MRGSVSSSSHQRSFLAGFQNKIKEKAEEIKQAELANVDQSLIEVAADESVTLSLSE